MYWDSVAKGMTCLLAAIPHKEVRFCLEPSVGLGIGVCCLTLENTAPGIYIHSLSLGSVAKMDSRLR